MRKGRFLSVFLALALLLSPICSYPALAVPAYPGPVTVEEPATGRKVDIMNYGDEYFNYSADTEGRVFVQDDGRFYYVSESNGSYSLGAPVTGFGMYNMTNGSSQDTRVKAGDKGLREKLTALRKSLPQGTEYYTQASQSNSIPYIPSDYDVNSSGSIDAAKGYVVYTDWDVLDAIQDAPRESTCPMLVLHITFNNAPAAYDDAAWHNMLFEGGVNGFYSAVSNNKFTYVPAPETSNIANDGVITVKLPFDVPLWGGSSPDNLSFNQGMTSGLYTGSDGKVYALYGESQLFLYGMIAAQQYLGNLAEYDRNSDGYLTPTEMAFYVIFPGYEASFRGGKIGDPAVWAHHWYTNDMQFADSTKTSLNENWFTPFVINGIKLFKYSIAGEVQKGTLENGVWSGQTQMQSGTFCHELGHDLGLMDLYDTSGSDFPRSVDALSVMAGGSWGHMKNNQPGSLPSHIDPYDKAWLHFYDTETASHSGTYTLQASEPSGSYNMLRINTADTAKTGVYYLLENRRNNGYDRGMYYSYEDNFLNNEGGIVVWRVDEEAVRKYWFGNTLNAHDGKYAMMPVFHDGNPIAPFWGGRYYGSGSTLELEGGVRLDFNAAAGDVMTVNVDLAGGSAREVFAYVGQERFYSLQDAVDHVLGKGGGVIELNTNVTATSDGIINPSAMLHNPLLIPEGTAVTIWCGSSNIGSDYVGNDPAVTVRGTLTLNNGKFSHKSKTGILVKSMDSLKLTNMILNNSYSGTDGADVITQNGHVSLSGSFASSSGILIAGDTDVVEMPTKLASVISDSIIGHDAITENNDKGKTVFYGSITNALLDNQDTSDDVTITVTGTYSSVEESVTIPTNVNLIVPDGEALQVSPGVTLNVQNITGIQGTIINAGGTVIGVPPERIVNAPAITTLTLPNGMIDVPYSAELIAEYSDPFAWEIVQGKLPDGLSLDAASGRISGTPYNSGTFSIRVMARVNNSIASTRRFLITIETRETSSGSEPYLRSVYTQKRAPYLDANGNLVLTIDAELSSFISVSIDGAPVERKDYDINGGSTIVTLHKDRISALKDGTHTIRVQFKDGYYMDTFTTPLDLPTTAAVAVVPATGGMPSIFGMLAAAAGLAVICRRKRSRI